MQTNMSPIQLATQLYEVNTTHQPFQIYVGFQDFPALDQNSPHVAVACAREIQNHCHQQPDGTMPNPVRINAFNVISEHAYTNPVFQEFVRYVLVRIYMGCSPQNGEFKNIIEAGNIAVPNMVRYFSAWLAQRNAMVLQSITDNAVLQNVARDAGLWERQMHMIAGQLPFEPFSTQLLNETLGGFSVAHNYANGQVDMSNSGAFVSGAHAAAMHHNQYRQNGNNASPEGNRFTRQLEARRSMLQGSMQTAMVNSGAAAVINDSTRWEQALAAQSELLKRSGKKNLHAVMQESHAQPLQQPEMAQEQMPTGVVQSPADIAKAALDSLKAVAPTPKSFIFNQKMEDGKEYGVIRMVRYDEREEKGVHWVSSPVQRNHPAWDPSCQSIAYSELENGQWIAMIVEGENMEDKLFSYEAHAISPLLGYPEPEQEVPAAKPEEEVQYSSNKKPRPINVVVPDRIMQELDEETIISSISKKVRGLEVTPEAYMNQGGTISLVSFKNQEAMLTDLEVVSSLAVANSFESVVGMLNGIDNQELRKIIDVKLTEGVNNWLRHQGGMPDLTIDLFSTDVGEIVEYVRDKRQAGIIADKLKASVNTIVTGAFKAASSKPLKDVLESAYGTEFSDERLERSLVLLSNYCAVWLNRDVGSFNVMVPDNQPCLINKKHLPYMFALAKLVFDETSKTYAGKVSYATLVLSDGKRYTLSESCMSTPETPVFFITNAKTS